MGDRNYLDFRVESKLTWLSCGGSNLAYVSVRAENDSVLVHGLKFSLFYCRDRS